jgi:tetratricopeptide (TPR) repeat protein
MQGAGEFFDTCDSPFRFFERHLEHYYPSFSLQKTTITSPRIFRMGTSVASLVAAGSFEKAVEAYEKGDLASANAHCLARLKSRPKDFDALHLLGIVQSRRGSYGAALDTFNKALKLRPNDADLINNRAGALTEAKRYQEALKAYERALEIRPDYASAHNNHGCVLMEMERFEDALSSYGRAVVLDPDNAEFVNNLGRALTRLRRYADALDCYGDALALRPDYDDALINRGVTLSELKRHDEALACFDELLTRASDHADALLYRAHVLMGLDRFEQALDAYDDFLLARRSDRHEVYLNRGFALTKLRRFEEAFKSYEAALARKVDPAEVLIARATTLREMDRVGEAIAEIDRALAMRPDYAEGYKARGFALVHAQRLPEAITSFKRAVELRADLAEADWNLGSLLLLHGNFHQGWRHYESRRTRKGTIWTTLQGPEWRGEPLRGKRLLLYAEQGFGDTLQFARFVGVAAGLGAQIIYGVYGPLAELFTAMDGNPIIVRNGETLPPYDYHAPIMSLPFILGLGENEIPADVPYLRADAARVESWKSKLPQSTFRVGIVWQGSKSDPERWVPLAAFAPLSRVPGVTLIGLQKTDGLEQLEALPPGMIVETLGPSFDAGPDAFLDSAAVMMNLDLVVSIDTGLAHLAGALACPVWIVLKQIPDWRWMLDRNDSPWYPTARLFRQRQKGEWEPVMKEVAAELALLIEQKNRGSGPPRHGSVGNLLWAPVSVGELIDKIVILEIKAARIADPEKLVQVTNELALLNQIDFGGAEPGQEISALRDELKQVNEALWDIEDKIRECERLQDFGPAFVELARAVYKTNDRRAVLKGTINRISGSAIVEMKAHPAY